ncbi:MAG: glycosyltransferase, partial [Dethiobacteria bacterium]|nr:glycosyltransferase [Dethiobacteria bacterium]
ESDRLYKLGREWVRRGDQVTVFTINKGTGLQLGQKKIGLFQSGGLNTVTFNVDYSSQSGNRKKFFSYLKFARMVRKQGLQLPKPDLILASSPPLSAVWPALKLKVHHKVPLVVEIRELWPDAPVQRGSLRGSLLIKRVSRCEQQVYENADRIIAGGAGIAEAIKERQTLRAKISIIPEGFEGTELIRLYDKAMAGLVHNKL